MDNMAKSIEGMGACGLWEEFAIASGIILLLFFIRQLEFVSRRD